MCMHKFEDQSALLLPKKMNRKYIRSAIVITLEMDVIIWNLLFFQQKKTVCIHEINAK